MILNDFEFLLMNNPVRRFIQRFIEIKKLREMSDLSSDKEVLEIGCGSGYGTKLIKKYFKPKKITAIDLDERMVVIAQAHNNDSTISHVVGDAASLSFPDNTFDAIVDFGIIHHIPEWRSCIRELYRVLKPGGQIIIEDLSVETFESPVGSVLKILLNHPYNDMYREEEFVDYVKEVGFKQIKIGKNSFYSVLPSFILVASKNKV